MCSYSFVLLSIGRTMSVFVPVSLNCHLALSLYPNTALSRSLSCMPQKLIAVLFVMGLIMQLYKCHLILLLFNSIEGKKRGHTSLLLLIIP